MPTEPVAPLLKVTGDPNETDDPLTVPTTALPVLSPASEYATITFALSGS